MPATDYHEVVFTSFYEPHGLQMKARVLVQFGLLLRERVFVFLNTLMDLGLGLENAGLNA